MLFHLFPSSVKGVSLLAFCPSPSTKELQLAAVIVWQSAHKYNFLEEALI